MAVLHFLEEIPPDQIRILGMEQWSDGKEKEEKRKLPEE
jgi:hypothetical protein